MNQHVSAQAAAAHAQSLLAAAIELLEGHGFAISAAYTVQARESLASQSITLSEKPAIWPSRRD